LDEGVTTNKADASKLKSVATLRSDTYRAPYDKAVKTYPRRFVFSMSTNQVDHLKDETGNRRFWTVECKQVDFKWLENNRAQLFAEAYHNIKNHIAAPALDIEDATRRQEEHVTVDPWEPVITEWVLANNSYRSGDMDFIVSGAFVFTDVLGDNIGRMDKRHEMKIGNILRDLGFEKVRRLVDGTRKRGYALTEKKALEKLSGLF
jgi:predicted P-loop ATPase